MQQFTGKQYLQIDIASNFGLDKSTWAARLSWFDAHEPKLEEMIHEAKEPALYYAGVKAWREVQQGLPTGYMISLDATSSGLQLLACLTGDKQAAQLCNVVPTGSREDAYTLVYDEMCRRIGDSSKISREDTKSAIMCALYGSKAMPKEIFGEGELLRIFYEVITEMAPGAWELNEAWLDMWNPEALSHNWVLPDNFHVKVKVMSQRKETIHFMNEPFDTFYKVNAPEEEGRSLGANTTHSLDGLIVRELTRRCDYDPKMVAQLKEWLRLSSFGSGNKTQDDQLVLTLWDHYKKSGYLSARILPHLNPDNIGHVELHTILDLLNSLPNKPFKVVSIHQWWI
jgi:hypothetical protein